MDQSEGFISQEAIRYHKRCVSSFPLIPFWAGCNFLSSWGGLLCEAYSNFVQLIISSKLQKEFIDIVF